MLKNPVTFPLLVLSFHLHPSIFERRRWWWMWLNSYMALICPFDSGTAELIIFPVRREGFANEFYVIARLARPQLVLSAELSPPRNRPPSLIPESLQYWSVQLGQMLYVRDDMLLKQALEERKRHFHQTFQPLAVIIHLGQQAFTITPHRNKDVQWFVTWMLLELSQRAPWRNWTSLELQDQNYEEGTLHM
ncbi:hypothetical protein BU17DRAFT_65500 [Hysterangium stoloniferum]|nr:hypothetical protein BU17DRAFT_65500 [Hysterangium stoloniferum]